MPGHTPWSEIRRGPSADERKAALRERILSGEHPTLTATYEHDAGTWFVVVLEAGAITSARTRDEVEAMARDITAIQLDVPADSFDLRVEQIDMN
jgi:hypothetical protein